MANLNDQEVKFGGKVFTLSPTERIMYNGKPSVVWTICHSENGATVQDGQLVASARNAERSAVEKFDERCARGV